MFFYIHLSLLSFAALVAASSSETDLASTAITFPNTTAGPLDFQETEHLFLEAAVEATTYRLRHKFDHRNWFKSFEVKALGV